MSVKIIEEDHCLELERKVNEFINGKDDIVEIKYSAVYRYPLRIYYSAMIIMR